MWRVGRAFGAGPLAISIDEVARTAVAEGESVIAIGGASTAPFEAIDGPATRAMLDAAIGPGGFAAAGTQVRALGDDAFGNLALVRLRDDGAVEVTWIGLVGAWLLRDGLVEAIAPRHSMRAEHPAAPDLPTRGLGAARADAEHATWAAAPGARVVCASWTIARLPADLIARLATGDDVDRAATRLVDTALRRDPGWPAVAVVAER
jgi:hypothetical protein